MYGSKMRIFFFLLLTMMTLAGCALPMSVIQLPAGEAVDTCPAAAAGQAQMINERDGYCLLYPEMYTPILSDQGSSGLFVNNLMDVEHPRLQIEVEDALGQSVAEVAAASLDEFKAAGFDITVSDGLWVGGEAAVMLHQLPGQDLNRMVLVVRDGRVYRLFFSPDEPNLGERYAEMEALLEMVLGSLSFFVPTAPTGLPLPADQAAVDYPENAALLWEGPIPSEGGTSCGRLALTTAGEATVGTCDAAQTVAAAAAQWDEILTRFAPFSVESDSEKLTLAGQGEISGEAWQRAVLAWTRDSYGELSSGRVSAAGRTALSWWLGEVDGQPGQCRHLVVLNYGYAYANVDPCQGGENISSVGGWLSDAEMDFFDDLLYNRGESYVDDNYVAGQGQGELSADEVEIVTAWAEGVYNRLEE